MRTENKNEHHKRQAGTELTNPSKPGGRSIFELPLPDPSESLNKIESPDERKKLKQDKSDHGDEEATNL